MGHGSSSAGSQWPRLSHMLTTAQQLTTSDSECGSAMEYCSMSAARHWRPYPHVPKAALQVMTSGLRRYSGHVQQPERGLPPLNIRASAHCG
eukprot:4733446-Alexandrium_andersonii.AAC.1